MAIASSFHPVAKLLTDAGIIPPLCRKWSITFEVNQAVKIQAEVFATEEQCRALGDVLVASAAMLPPATEVAVPRPASENHPFLGDCHRACETCGESDLHPCHYWPGIAKD